MDNEILKCIENGEDVLFELLDELIEFAERNKLIITYVPTDFINPPYFKVKGSKSKLEFMCA